MSARVATPIRARLLRLALAILLPAVLAAALAVWFVYTEQQQAQAQSMAAASKAFAVVVDKELRAVEATLTALARSPDLARGDLDSFAGHMRSLAPDPSRVLVLSTPEGQQLINTRARPGVALPRINAGIVQLREAHPGVTVFSNLYMGALSGRKDIAVDVPVTISAQRRYHLSMGITVSEFQNVLNEQHFPASWIATITDRNGVVLARSRDPQRFIGQRASAAMLKRVLAGEVAGVNYGTTLDGHDVAAFFARAPESGWTVLLSIPMSEMHGPALRASLVLGVTLLFLLSGAVLAAGRYARATALPIERLRHAAELLGQGQPVERGSLAGSGLLETDQVGDALAYASEQVLRHQGTLELRVAEAVGASERAQRALLQAQKLEALGRLTGGIAHDFNNILQTLSSALEVLRLAPDPGRAPRLLAICDKAIDRATALTAQLRAFGRVQDVRLETVGMGEAVAGVLPLLKSALPSNIELETTLHGGARDAIWPVTIDRLQFELALLNIVINARDALPGGGRIALALHNTSLGAGALAQDDKTLPAGDYVVLTVTDNGSGMAPEVLASCLDPFFTTKSVERGSGLGLPQAYGFAIQANGMLTLASTVGQGTSVTIHLPRASAVVASLPAPPSASMAKAAGTVLFVEDDELVRATVAPALEQAGFAVLQASTGDEALSLLDAGADVQVVFSDVIMPGALNGVELARIVRARFPALRVLLASGHADMAIDLPGVQMLGKPYDIAAVIGVLAGAGERPL